MLSAGLARAVAGSSQARAWQDICSLDGGGATQRDDGMALHATHCAFCSKYDHAPALLPQVDLVTIPRLRQAPPMVSVLPWRARAAPRWTHRPRGPPRRVTLA